MKTTHFNKMALPVLLVSLTVSLTANAGPMTAKEGLDKINTNVENAKANKNEYDRNLGVVNKNLGEVNKVKSAYQKQKDSVSAEIVKNNDSLKKISTQERDINALISQEKEKLQAEARQLEQLEKMMNQIKTNQAQREAIIADYQNQLRVAQDEKTAWKDREAELRAQEAKAIQSVRTVAAEEANWTKKKKTYEGEVKRWTAETEKQQQIQNTYKGLAGQ